MRENILGIRVSIKPKAEMVPLFSLECSEMERIRNIQFQKNGGNLERVSRKVQMAVNGFLPKLLYSCLN